MNKYRIIILIVAVLIVVAGTLAAYLHFSSRANQASPISSQNPADLWPNGKRCPQNNFGGSIKKEDIITTPAGTRVTPSELEVHFALDATCEDAERIARLLNAKIDSHTKGHYLNLEFNDYEFKLPTHTVEELYAALERVQGLHDPKIKGANPAYSVGTFIPR